VVLRTRRGIQISLAVLWIELARAWACMRGRLFSRPLHGQGQPAKGQVVIDPFTGQSLSREELSERLEPYKRRNGLVDEFEVPLGLYLQAAPPRDIIARMLRNLKEIHAPGRLAAPDRGAGRLVILLPMPGPSTATGPGPCRAGAHFAGGRRPGDLPGSCQDALDIDAIADRVADLRRARS